MIDKEDLWNNAEWLSQTRLLLKKLKEFSSNSRTALILRHSQRYEPSPWELNGNMEITPEGIKAAYIFGRLLPSNISIKIYHSPVTRCQVTAKQIHEGYIQVGGKSEIIGEVDILQKFGIDKDTFIEELKKQPIHEIINRWIAGIYPSEKWPSWQHYCQNAAKIIWNQIDNLPNDTLAIFVTHDVHLMILRFGWFGLPISNKWISYLNGFAFSFENAKIKLLDSGNIKLKEIPYWWNKSNKK